MNLSEVVVRTGDSIDDLKRKVRVATILGTLQSTLTKFRYLRPIWEQNTEEERLLGVSLTGIMDHEILSDANNPELPTILEELKNVAIETNKAFAEKLQVDPSVAITCVKPSGTVSQLVDAASGIHPRFAEYYIRTVRADQKDPLAIFMREQNFPCEIDAMKPNSGLVFSFPMKAPESAIMVEQVGAMEQLKLWKIFQDHWCEHKPSITVYYKDHEFLEAGQWLYNNFDSVSGISFLPYSDHTYKQAPYQKIDKEEYEAFLKKMPQNVDWGLLSTYEEDDNTSGTQTMACSGNSCEMVDIQ